MFKNKIILISGGTGSWGNELTKQLLIFKPKEIRIYSRGEFAQVTMQRKFNNPTLKFIIGDVRDYKALKKATKNVDFIFHAAALKHVPICEEQPEEAIKTNINGTINLTEAALANNVKIVVDISTDKAVSAHNLYGLTKAVGEHLILAANKLDCSTDFKIIRGGNAIGSAGSVIPLFIEQIKRYNEITLTDKRMTRYFITLPEAINLVLTAAKIKTKGGILVMKMPSCKMIDLAEVLIESFGNKNTKIKIIGMRIGEKLHEMLISPHEALISYTYNKNYYLISSNKMNLTKVRFNQYTSQDFLLNKKQIKKMLEKGGYLK